MNDPSSSSAGAGTSELEPSVKRANPYVGPRPFAKGELFFGREREAASVVNSLLSGRVLLLHAPSGAGKTSLIQTSVVPSFEGRSFLTCAGTELRDDNDPKFTALRVNLPPPADVPNRYVYSVVNGLIGHFTDYEHARGMTIAEAVEEFAREHNVQQRQLLVFDQLEEILTLNQGDVEGQIAFFKQLGEALDDSRRWALLAMREDYIGALDRFRQYLPGQLRAAFRLDLLDVQAALRAVQKPAQACGVDFHDDAAQMLVNDLRLVYSGRGDEDIPTMQSPYVEPALLQVVCYDLFRGLSKEQGSKFDAITVENVENFKPFDKSISKYYRAVIREATKEVAPSDAAKDAGKDAAKEAVPDNTVKKDRHVEHALRDWVGHDLIGQQRLRRQTRQKPQVPKADAALGVMQGMYLIRDDPRPGGPPLWELSHDMLVGPVLEDNRAFRAKHLDWWQVQAEDWDASGQNPAFLLQGNQYQMAAPHRKREGLTKTEQAYLKASAEAYRAEGLRSRLRLQLWRTSILLALSLVVNVVLLVLLWHWF